MRSQQRHDSLPTSWQSHFVGEQKNHGVEMLRRWTGLPSCMRTHSLVQFDVLLVPSPFTDTEEPHVVATDDVTRRVHIASTNKPLLTSTSIHFCVCVVGMARSLGVCGTRSKVEASTSRGLKNHLKYSQQDCGQSQPWITRCLGTSLESSARHTEQLSRSQSREHRRS